MQCAKAKFVGDEAAAMEIMMETNPSAIKHISDRVQDTKLKAWDKEASEHMYVAVHAKFSQNRDLGKAMCATGDRKFVECNIHDVIWGVGLALNDATADDEQHWIGGNKLGLILDRVRAEIS